MTTREHMQAALKGIRAESARLDARIKTQIPAMREIAEHGKTDEERDLARRWLALA